MKKFIVFYFIVLILILFSNSQNTFAQDFSYTPLEGHTNSVHRLVFSPNGKTLASASEDRTIRLWDVATGTHKYTLTGHNAWISSIAFSPDGKILASADSEHRIRLWNAATGQYRVTLEGHQAGVSSVAFSPDGKTLASADSNAKIRLWNATTGVYRVTLEGHTNTIHSIKFSPDGKTLASADTEGKIRLWDATTGFHKQTLTEHTRRVYDIVFIENGKTLVSMSTDNTIRFWDVATGQQKKYFENNLSNVTINAAGTMIASRSSRTIYLWDIATETEIANLTGHTSDVYSITFSPNGKMLASGGADRIIRLWKLATHVNISPSTVEVPAVSEQFDIDINIIGGKDVRGYKVTIQYDSTSLQYVSHTHSDYLSDEVFEGPTVSKQGQVSFSNASLADAGSGDGTLATITFQVISRTESTISLSATLSNSNGERIPFLVVSGKVIEPPWDVNGDGTVDILDLSFVAARFGQEDQTEADINRDGVVDIKDLITVASGMNTEAAAPLARNSYRTFMPSRAEVQQWLIQAQQLNLTDAISQRGIHFLQQLLAALTPKKTALLPNYPNPFNPETWIPYQLSEPADVMLTIYTIDGTVVRTLSLGYQPVGIYQSKSRAAYWNGKNALSEPVASGVYFYTLTADDFSDTRKMLIRK